MSTATITRPESVTVAPVVPLSADETNSLIEIAAGSEKIARVKGGVGTGTARGWSMGGMVD